MLDEVMQEQLEKIKVKIFSNILEEQNARIKEREDGIIHIPSCFSQIPPWKV